MVVEKHNLFLQFVFSPGMTVGLQECKGCCEDHWGRGFQHQHGEGEQHGGGAHQLEAHHGEWIDGNKGWEEELFHC